MILETQYQLNFKKMVANRLAEKLIWFLFPSKKGENFSDYIGGMAVIPEWAGEFHSQY